MTTTGWRWAYAAVAGERHYRQGTSCQDHATCHLLRDVAGCPVLLALAADGAGSAACAKEGAVLACASMLQAVRTTLTAGAALDSLEAATVQDWLVATQAALLRRAAEAGTNRQDYATTLLAAIVGVHTALFVQLGDGLILVEDVTGRWRWIAWPQRGPYVNTTRFLTDGDAAEAAAIVIDHTPIHGLALLTDGIEPLVVDYASREPLQTFFAAMERPIRASSAEAENVALSNALVSYLGGKAIRARTDDDTTLMVAVRGPATPGR